MAIQHIPAWKRLGLKLKYANETAPTTQSNFELGGGRKKRRLEDGIDTTNNSNDQQHQLKKSRVEHETSQGQLNGEDKHVILRTPKNAVAKRKKSVTFASDTKIEDGESAQTIQFWVPGSPGSTPKKQSGDLGASEPVEPAESPIRRKKEKKAKDQRKKLSAPLVARKGVAALEYLDQFHHQRTSWKFNKNHEVWLLKHALSTEYVPPEHNLALASYIHGLKSAAARQRLIEQCHDAAKTTDVSAQEEANMRAKILHVLDPSHDNDSDDAEQKPWFEDQNRAQLLLLSLNEDLQQPKGSVQSNGQALPRVKKNKSRTARVEVESSSSSESDSESDSDAEGKTDLVSEAHKRLASRRSNEVATRLSDDTSSDATSDSSSDNSSEDGENSSTSSDSE